MKYYSREILEQYLKDTRFNKVLDIIDETEPYLTTGKTVPARIKVRLCRECPFFEIDGIQSSQDVTRGWCRRLSFEGEGKYTPHYIRVDTNSFCNDDHASEGDDIEIL